jgi:hypothetical protein
MKRFLFMFCGAALAIIAGGRVLILLADIVTSPNSYSATAHIQLSQGTPLLDFTGGFSTKDIDSITGSEHFRKLLSGMTSDEMRLNQREAVELIEKVATLKTDTANRQVLVSVVGSNPENVTAVAQVLGRTWLAQNITDATMLPVQPATVLRPYRLPSAWSVFKSPHLYIPILLAIAGGVFFNIGWWLPRTEVSSSTTAVVLAPKY